VRGYRFDVRKIAPITSLATESTAFQVTEGQRDCEWAPLMHKRQNRNPACHAQWRGTEPQDIALHPLFQSIPGDIASWERTEDGPGAR
jgi:hypothetical protein